MMRHQSERPRFFFSSFSILRCRLLQVCHSTAVPLVVQCHELRSSTLFSLQKLLPSGPDAYTSCATKPRRFDRIQNRLRDEVRRAVATFWSTSAGLVFNRLYRPAPKSHSADLFLKQQNFTIELQDKSGMSAGVSFGGTVLWVLLLNSGVYAKSAEGGRVGCCTVPRGRLKRWQSLILGGAWSTAGPTAKVKDRPLVPK